MSQPQRPWWLFVNQPQGLVTRVHEEAGVTGQRTFVIKGEPVIQGLTWLTCGPLGALLVIGLLTAAAILLDVQSSARISRFLFVAAFLVLPALVWGGVVLVSRRLAAPHLEALRAAQTRECRLTLNQRQEQLHWHTPPQAPSKALSFEQVERVYVSPAVGARDGKSMVLMLDTALGAVVLLDEQLGTHPQKADLAQIIDTALQEYRARNKKSPA